MINYPLLYLFIYCKIRKKTGGDGAVCTKADFRKMLSQPLGIDKRMAEFILRDFQRFGMIGEITKGKRGRIEFIRTGENQELFADLLALKEAGLI